MGPGGLGVVGILKHSPTVGHAGDAFLTLWKLNIDNDGEKGNNCHSDRACCWVELDRGDEGFVMPLDTETRRIVVPKQEYRLKCDFVEFEDRLAFAFRRALGIEPKNRVEVRVSIERELLQAFYDGSGSGPRSGELSNMVNRAVAGYMIMHGLIK